MAMQWWKEDKNNVLYGVSAVTNYLETDLHLHQECT